MPKTIEFGHKLQMKRETNCVGVTNLLHTGTESVACKLQCSYYERPKFFTGTGVPGKNSILNEFKIAYIIELMA